MSENWYRPAPPAAPSPQYDAIDAEVRDLTLTLRDAPGAALAAEQDRLRARAGEIVDELWRTRALRRIDELAQLVTRPRTGGSPQYREANAIAGQVLARQQGEPAERITEAERAIAAIGELARQAPPEEAMAIRGLNPALTRLVDGLKRQR